MGDKTKKKIKKHVKNTKIQFASDIKNKDIEDHYDYYHFDTFVNKIGEPVGKKIKNYPNNVKFQNLLINGHDYFQIYIECDLDEPNEIVFPNKPFYITNDEDDNLYYKIVPKGHLTRIKLAIKIMNWLIIRNAYYDIKFAGERDDDIPDYELGVYANNISVHGLVNSGRKRKGLPIYNIDNSS